MILLINRHEILMKNWHQRKHLNLPQQLKKQTNNKKEQKKPAIRFSDVLTSRERQHPGYFVYGLNLLMSSGLKMKQ